MMRALHEIVGSLMYAENFYIVLYDAAHRQHALPVFRRRRRHRRATAEPTPCRCTNALHSLTWHLLRAAADDGHARRTRNRLGERSPRSVPNAIDWLGVPMLRGGDVVGGIVVQSYRADTRYSAGRSGAARLCRAAHPDRARARAGAPIWGATSTERTDALREANRVLRQQVMQRQRGERLQAALFRIAELANTSESLDKFYAAVHHVIGGLLYSRNFYIALLAEDTDQLTLSVFGRRIRSACASRASSARA